MNPYKILGLEDNASLEAAKAAFKTLIKKYHPDVDKSSDAKVKFQQVSDAYDMIKNGYKVGTNSNWTNSDWSNSDWTNSSYYNDYSSFFNDYDQEKVKDLYEAFMRRSKSHQSAENSENPFKSKIITVKKTISVSLKSLQDGHVRDIVIDGVHNIKVEIPKNTNPFFKFYSNITQNGYTFHIDFEWKINDAGYTIENHRLVKTVNISAKDFFMNDSFIVENHNGKSFEVKLKEGMSTNKMLRIPKAGIIMGKQSDLIDDLYVKINVIK